MRIPFGKHKGIDIREVGRDYLIWLALFDLTEDGVDFLGPDDDLEGADRYISKYQMRIVWAARKELSRRKICWACEKPLCAVGKSRVNGANHRDWATRKLHKKCWLELKQ